MTGIAANLNKVRALVDAALRQSDRRTDCVSLLAVSKTWPAEAVREAFAAGQRDFGENYLQEAVEKIAKLEDIPLIWHFIGPIQSNKTAQIARLFQWVHSVDRLKVAQRLAEHRSAGQSPLNVCLQVNVSGETSKSGATPEAIPDLAQAVSRLEGLRLRGLMCIPEPTMDESILRSRFRALVKLRDRLNSQLNLALDTLSMGMSADMLIAIEEGATIVRVGSAIFGTRQRKAD